MTGIFVPGTDEYLGKVAVSSRLVLEIGPASGFLTFEMEKRGAQVVSIEATDDPGWDFVPYPASRLQPILGPRRTTMRRLKNSFWLSHAAYRSRARVYYGDIYNLPATLKNFDFALMGSVLLHCRSPLQIVEAAAKRARSIIITDMFYPELESSPICRLAPDTENFLWHT